MSDGGLSGRQGEARRNDAAILASARAVFVANPDAPVAAVAEHAGVNISSLYRRFSSKEELLRRLCSDGLKTYLEAVRAAVDDQAGEPWEAFATFMTRIVEADVHALTVRLAGRFTPTEENLRDAVESFSLNEQLVARTQAAGALRADINAHDLTFIFEQLTSLTGATAERTAEIKARYLALHLDALRAPGRTPLPGPAPGADEQFSRWGPAPPDAEA
ncbi:MAG: TetR/AcrR family transcriptional regulator [Acidimicrobiales bacterium]